MDATRFRDENKGLSEFQTKVLVECPVCGRQAYATVNYETKVTRLICAQCGYNKTEDITSAHHKAITFIKAAHSYFNARLWYQHPFKEDIFWAYNNEHLQYLENYIGAKLREHQDRTGFTLVERLPKFYHDAKNRKELLKIITYLKSKPK